MENELMTIEEAAKYFRSTPATIRRLVKSSELPGIRVGRQFRIRRLDLEAWMQRQEQFGLISAGSR